MDNEDNQSRTILEEWHENTCNMENDDESTETSELMNVVEEDEQTHQNQTYVESTSLGDEECDSEDFDTDDEDIDEQETTEAETTENTEDVRGLVGLQNLGNTCYMNGALQALSNCQQLTRFVLDCPGFLKEKGLCHSYSELIKEIWYYKNSQCAVPASIIRNIKCIYPAFRGCTQQDTQEFLRCFLEQLHDELKQPVITSIQQQRRHQQLQQQLNQHQQGHTAIEEEGGGEKGEAMDGTSGDNTPVVHRSIISDTFEFKISSSVVCSNCNNVSTTKETFKDLSIPIPSRDHSYYQIPVNSQNSSEISSDTTKTTSTATTSDSDTTKQDGDCKLSQEASTNQHDDRVDGDSEACGELQPSYLNSFPLARWFWSWLSSFGSWFWGPQVKLQDCLSIFFGTDPLEGDNEYSCEICTKKNRGVKFLKILELPEVLCIHFKRYESIGSAKITTHVSFPLTGLDLAPFMSDSSKPQCTTYNLIACICHHGSALLTGHYTTYALNCYDDQWYEFDDQYVTQVSNYQVENSEAYILFYQKSTIDNRTDRQRVKASRLLKKSLSQSNIRKYFISKQWVTKFNTFVEPGPITNFDFLCEHEKIPKSRQPIVSQLCHQVSENVWKYLRKLHGGGPDCQDLVACDICE